MRSWWKRYGILAGGLLGLGALAAPAEAQFGTPPPARPVSSALFGNGEAPAPPRAASDPNTFTLRDDGTPNAFVEDDVPPAGTQPYCISFRGEYLRWFVSKGSLNVPLVTTSSTPNATNNFGALGQSATQVLLNSGDHDYDRILGGRMTLGIAPGCFFPFEISGFWLRNNSTLFAQASDGSILLARPVQLVTNPGLTGGGAQDVYFSGFPGAANGFIDVTSRLKMWGVGADFFLGLSDGKAACSLDVILGYKHLELEEDLLITSAVGPSALVNFNGNIGIGPGFVTTVHDDFNARSTFDGGTIGVRMAVRCWRMALLTDAKLGLGNTHQTLRVSGTSTLGDSAGGGLAVPGGILAGASNSGTFTRNTFSAIPELNVNLSFQVHDCVRVYGGYNLLYWTSVLRAGQQLDSGVDPRQVPTDRNFVPGFTGTGPQPLFNTTGFFAHGLNVGLEIAY